MLVTDIISKKKHNQEHTPEEIQYLVQNYAKGTIPDYQVAAWLMATWVFGLSEKEAFLLTDEIMKSGAVFDFSYLNRPIADKHSTGGVGDKTSLVLAPIVASCGVAIPMIAGRGLGHTGGTVDKFESIPGFSAEISEEKFKKMVEENNLSFIGQTENICPADKKMYALRDVTSTVDSNPLICASIMSKKLAEGIESLVLDVKYGTGAFMQTLEEAQSLARNLVNIGVHAGKNVSALITNMNQPLGRFIGNSLEVEECLRILKNEDPEGKFIDTTELSLELAAEMLYLSKISKTREEARVLAKNTLASGKAYEKFEQTMRLHGGDLDQLPTATQSYEVLAESTGFIHGFNAQDIGYASVILGAGRQKTGDKINSVAGMEVHKKTGDSIEKGEPLFTLYSSETTHFAETAQRLKSTVFIKQEPAQALPLVADKILKEFA